MDQIRKRVVLLPRSAPAMIVGTFDGTVHKVRDFIEFDYNDIKMAASLLKITPRAIYYREVMEPPESGKLGQFHPQQR